MVKVFPQLMGNILFQLIYLHIVSVDWWKPTAVKYSPRFIELPSHIFPLPLPPYFFLFSLPFCLLLSPRHHVFKLCVSAAATCLFCWLHTFLSYSQRESWLWRSVLCWLQRLLLSFPLAKCYEKAAILRCFWWWLKKLAVKENKPHCHCCNIRICIWE